MYRSVPIQEFEILDAQIPLVDARSPSEYLQGHIPGAINIPLLTDSERVEVGTIYKQVSVREATLAAFRLTGPRMHDIALQLLAVASGGILKMYCWRGGKRSGNLAWLANQLGIEVILLQGGYKAFRTNLLEFITSCKLDLHVIGGPTGIGKTEIIHLLQQQGEQIIDLENLANHKGSAFGHLGELPQPSVEMFENKLFHALRQLDMKKRIWVENESRSIGRCFIPAGFWEQMKAGTLYQCGLDEEERIQRLVQDYGNESIADLIICFDKIKTKLGGLHHKEALDALEHKDLNTAARIALNYYDKTYQHSLENNPTQRIKKIDIDPKDRMRTISELIQCAQS